MIKAKDNKVKHKSSQKAVIKVNNMNLKYLIQKDNLMKKYKIYNNNRINNQILKIKKYKNQNNHYMIN